VPSQEYTATSKKGGGQKQYLRHAANGAWFVVIRGEGKVSETVFNREARPSSTRAPRRDREVGGKKKIWQFKLVARRKHSGSPKEKAPTPKKGNRKGNGGETN